MAQIAAARLEMMLMNQRLLTAKTDDGWFDSDILSRSDIASRANAVTIAVSKAAFIQVKTRNIRRYNSSAVVTYLYHMG